MTLQNKFAPIDEKNEVSVERLNGNHSLVMNESAEALGEETCREQTEKLRKQMKYLGHINTKNCRVWEIIFN